MPVIQLARQRGTAVPVGYILETGQVPLSNIEGNHSFIDLSQKDASGVRALDTATAQAFSTMQRNPEVRALLALPSWNKPQRTAYESLQADAVAQAFHAQPLFSEYRQTAGSNQDHAAQDLTHMDRGDELDCDKMAVFKGIMLTRIERGLLPINGPGMKRPAEYYVAGGVMKLDGDGLPASAHVAIISSATGNVIEATWTHRPYLTAAHSYSFGDFVAGRPFLADRHVTVDGRDLHLQYQFGSLASGMDQAARRSLAWQGGDAEALKVLAEHQAITAPEFETGIAAEHRLEAARRGAGISGLLPFSDAAAGHCRPDPTPAPSAPSRSCMR